MRQVNRDNVYYYGLALLALDIYLAIHAYNTGRERWIFVILLVSFAGALVYLFVIWMPDMERSLDAYSRREQWNRPQPIARTWGEDKAAPGSKELADPAQKLKFLKGMLDDELINEADYEKKKADSFRRGEIWGSMQKVVHWVAVGERGREMAFKRLCACVATQPAVPYLSTK